MDRKGKKKIATYVFLIALMLITACLVLKSLDISMLSNVIEMVNKEYLLIGAIAILFYILLEGIILQIIINEQNKMENPFMGFKLGIMGFYYNLVTPFATGSQPVQVYILNKYKVPLSKATGIVTNKTILYQLVTTIYCTIFIFTNVNRLDQDLRAVMPFVILGLSINLFTFLIAFLAIINKPKIKIICHRVISYLSKFKLFKFLRSTEDKIDIFIDEYTESIKFFIRNKKLLAVTVVLTAIQKASYFSIAYWIYRALNLNSYSLMYLMTLQIYLYMAISPIPTPGNIGANELAFFTIFKGVFPQIFLGYAVFLYGGFVYYFILILSGIFTVYLHYRMSRDKEFGKINIKTI
ncbi:lysylphosphatidylglycerol synthase transmembrane domain-containing protein [Terrisporobacter sp.]